MQIAVWIGVFVALAGLGGIFWCIWLALDLRRSGITGDDAARRLARIGALNMASLGVAVIGLMIAVVAMLL